VLRALGEAWRAQVIIVPGNHDADLVGRWLARARRPCLADDEIPLDATPALARLAELLRPAQVRAHYPASISTSAPGRRTAIPGPPPAPEVAFGIAPRLLGRLPRDGATPADYEGGPRSRAWRRWRPAGLPGRWPDSRRRRRAVARDDDAGPAPAGAPPVRDLNAALLGAQVRRAAVPALARVVHRLGSRPTSWSSATSTARAQPDDDLARWRGPDGRLRIVNTGAGPTSRCCCTTPRRAPVLAGGAVVLEDDGEPEAIGLLDHLDGRALNRQRGTDELDSLGGDDPLVRVVARGGRRP
jgi:hypothetical protein